MPEPALSEPDLSLPALPQPAGAAPGDAPQASPPAPAPATPAGPAPAGSGAPAPELPPARKAAIVVRVLLEAGAPLSLADLPEEAQAELARQIAALGPVDRATVEAVAEEFAARIEGAGLTGGTGLPGALALLDGAISPALAQRLRAQAGPATGGDPWARIAEAPPERLVALLAEQSTEVAAVVLSRLRVSLAAELLGLMPGERARRVTYAVSLTTAATPVAVERIGQAVAAALELSGDPSAGGSPVDRVGAILNSARAAIRNEVLAGLDETDAAFAEEVRRAIFTFANIPGRIDPRDVPRITRQVEQPVLVRALAAAGEEMPEARDFLLGALSQRMADALRGEIEELGAVDPEAGEDAMREVVAAIRAMEEAGEIHLLAEEG